MRRGRPARCADALAWARGAGYAGTWFDAVVEPNRSAVARYERLGFTVIGTVPGAFEHLALGRIGLHVMHCPF